MGYCSKNHYVSGDICKLCEIRIKPEKEKITSIKKVSNKRAKELPEYSAKKKKVFRRKSKMCSLSETNSDRYTPRSRENRK
jgi:hypothetical protein